MIEKTRRPGQRQWDANIYSNGGEELTERARKCETSADTERRVGVGVTADTEAEAEAATAESEERSLR